MNSPIEEQLTRALASQATATEPTDEAWATVVTRGRAIGRRHSRRRVAAVVTVAAVMIGAVVVVGLERSRRDQDITFGHPPHAAVDSQLVELARRSIVLADAVAHEGAVSAAEPATEPAAVARARAANDAAADAWRPLAAEVADRGELSAVARRNVDARLEHLPEIRQVRDQHTADAYILLYQHLADEALNLPATLVEAAPTPAAARQLADARAIAALALEWWRFPALVGHPNFVNDSHRAIESGRLLVDEVAPARRVAVAAIVGDTRLDDVLQAQGSSAERDPTLTPLAAERQSRLVALALDILATPPAAPPNDVDPDLVRAVRNDGLRVLEAANREMWAMLVGDAGELTGARSRVDSAVAAARPSRDRLRDTAGGVLPTSEMVDETAGQALGYRTVLDDTGDPVRAAWAMLAAMDTEAHVLNAAGELVSTEQWRRANVVDALAGSVTDLTMAGALALRRLDNAPSDHTGTVDAARMADLGRRHVLDEARFDRNASGDDRATWRALSDTSPVTDFVTVVSENRSLVGDGQPWAVQRDEIRRHLDTATATVARFAG